MQYWRDAKQTEKEAPQCYTFSTVCWYCIKVVHQRKLPLKQKILLTLMKLHLALLTEDLAFRFQVSSATASSIIITWIKLISKELSVLIIGPAEVR